MTNVAFYLSNRNTKNVDCTDVSNGNPGIGGSEYALLLLACSLTQKYNDLNVIIYADENRLLPPILNIKEISGLSDLVRKTKEDNVHILTLILGTFNNPMLDSFCLNEHLKIIIWASNFFWGDKRFEFLYKE